MKLERYELSLELEIPNSFIEKVSVSGSPKGPLYRLVTKQGTTYCMEDHQMAALISELISAVEMVAKVAGGQNSSPGMDGNAVTRALLEGTLGIGQNGIPTRVAPRREVGECEYQNPLDPCQAGCAGCGGLTTRAANFAKRNQKIQAIKELRLVSGISLRDAKDAVESWCRAWLLTRGAWVQR